jgi:hypothetical protein
VSRYLIHSWLPFSVVTGAALALWGLAAAHGYGWLTIWLPAAVAGAAWPRKGKPTNQRQCRERVGGQTADGDSRGGQTTPLLLARRLRDKC